MRGLREFLLLVVPDCVRRAHPLLISQWGCLRFLPVGAGRRHRGIAPDLSTVFPFGWSIEMSGLAEKGTSVEFVCKSG